MTNKPGTRFRYRQFPQWLMKMISFFGEEVAYPLRYDAQGCDDQTNGYEFACNEDLANLEKIHPLWTFEKNLNPGASPTADPGVLPEQDPDMAAEIISTDGDLITLRVSGRLTQSELSGLQQRSTEIIARAGKVRVLVLVEHFEGWEQGGQWDDFAFQEANDARIIRMAIVGDEKWRDLALLFTSKDLREFPVEYFPAEQLVAARTWLMS